MDPDEFVATLLFRHGAADEPLVRERMYSEVLLGDIRSIVVREGWKVMVEILERSRKERLT